MTCAHCRSEFTRTSNHQRFCSSVCHRAFWIESRSDAAKAIERGPVRTLQEVAAALGMSKSRVDQIERSALRKLRGAMRREEWL